MSPRLNFSLYFSFPSLWLIYNLFFIFSLPFLSTIQFLQDEALLSLPVSVDRWRPVQDQRCLHRAIGKDLFFFLTPSLGGWSSGSGLRILNMISMCAGQKGGWREMPKEERMYEGWTRRFLQIRPHGDCSGVGLPWRWMTPSLCLFISSPTPYYEGWWVFAE